MGSHARVIAVAAAIAIAGLVPNGAVAAGPEPNVVDPIVVESKDGTEIVATLMLPGDASASRPAPAILKTHGWGGTRDRSTAGFNRLLLERGYALVTWDSRGFGDSGGEANVGAPGFEVEDAKALIDYLASRKEILRDGPGDPRVGWIGGSNAAGIQFNTAALDDRVDAIVPEISWGDLVQDLVPNGVIKNTWDLLLYGAGAATAAANGIDSPAGPQTGVYAEQIHKAFAEGVATGELSRDSRKWFGFRSTTKRSAQIEAPTLIIQGTVDTLFPLQDAFENYRNLARAKTPVKMIAYCSGHTIGCPYPAGASGHPDGADDKMAIYQQRILSWLDRYVKGLDVDTGAGFEWQAQDGYYYASPRFPLPGTEQIAGAKVSATLVGPGPGGGDGALDGNPAPSYELAVSATRHKILEGKRRPVALVGRPRVQLKGEVMGAGAFLFFELVDVDPDSKRVTVDDQVMPLRLGAGEFETKLDLHGIAWILRPGHALELEVTTGSAQYQPPRTGAFAVTFEAKTVLPLAPLDLGARID